jgi:hypothetical protein
MRLGSVTVGNWLGAEDSSIDEAWKKGANFALALTFGWLGWFELVIRGNTWHADVLLHIGGHSGMNEDVECIVMLDA